jgi:hypothetical protein
VALLGFCTVSGANGSPAKSKESANSFQPTKYPLVHVRNTPQKAASGAAGMIALRPGHTLSDFGKATSPQSRIAAPGMTIVKGTSRAGGVIGIMPAGSLPYSKAQIGKSGKLKVICVDPSGHKDAH